MAGVRDAVADAWARTAGNRADDDRTATGLGCEVFNGAVLSAAVRALTPPSVLRTPRVVAPESVLREPPSPGTADAIPDPAATARPSPPARTAAESQRP